MNLQKNSTSHQMEDGLYMNDVKSMTTVLFRISGYKLWTARDQKC